MFVIIIIFIGCSIIMLICVSLIRIFTRLVKGNGELMNLRKTSMTSYIGSSLSHDIIAITPIYIINNNKLYYHNASPHASLQMLATGWMSVIPHSRIHTHHAVFSLAYNIPKAHNDRPHLPST